MKITDEMVEAALQSWFRKFPSLHGDKGYLAEMRAALTAALAEQKQQGMEVKDWHRSDNAYGGVMLYSLREDGWRKGEPVMVNDVTIRIERAPGSETDIEPIVQRVLAALIDVQAVESEPVAWYIERNGERLLTDNDIIRDRWVGVGREPMPLYAHPPRSTLAPAPAGEDVEELRGLLDEAEEYVIDAITSAKEQVAMNEPYPTRAVRADARLAELRDLHSRIRAALSTRKGSAGDGSATGTKGGAE